METSYQAALDHFHEALDILTLLLIEEVKLTDPEKATELTVIQLKKKSELEKLEVCTDKAAELKSICVEICDKTDECSVAIIEKPLLEKERKQEGQSNTFKKPVLDNQPVVQLGSFGKGKKRTHEDAQPDTSKTDGEAKENNKPEDPEQSSETDPSKSGGTTPAKASPEQIEMSHKRQKTEEVQEL